MLNDTTVKAEQAGFVTISAVEAKQIMDTQKGYIILDVREQEEYKQLHIPGAKLLPLGQIEARAEQELPDKEQLLLVHCRSGVRSKKAAAILVKLGYKTVKDFGGIIDWPYEKE